MSYTEEICNKLIGKTIEKIVSLDGFGFEVLFTDGAEFNFSASDGDFSGYELIEKKKE